MPVLTTEHAEAVLMSSLSVVHDALHDFTLETCVPHSGDTAWMLVSTILVLSMVPGLALFEAGLLRLKNSMSIFAQTLTGLMVLSIMWVLFGYSLAFGADNAGIIGSLDKALLLNVSFTRCILVGSAIIEVPEALFAVFQMMFACITPLLMVGAVAERVSFKPFVAFIVLWELLVYYPMAHWVWSNNGWLATLGAVDYAGGAVIHTSAGFSSLVLALLLGRRVGYDEVNGRFPYSDLRMAAAGTAFLWIGWFGFNAGSGLRASSAAIQTVANTQVAACMSGVVWLLASWIEDKPSAVAMLNGAVAGLATITPAAGYIITGAAVGVSFVGGLASFFASKLLLKLRIDDALGVTAVHGVTGVIGVLAAGLFASNDVNEVVANGLAYGDGGVLLGWQAVLVAVTVAYSMLMTTLIALVVNRIAPLRVPYEVEVGGLDRFAHRERAMRMDHRLALSTSSRTRSTHSVANATLGSRVAGEPTFDLGTASDTAPPPMMSSPVSQILPATRSRATVTSPSGRVMQRRASRASGVLAFPSQS